MSDAPERIWANIEDEGDGPFIEFLSDEPWSPDDPGTEYVRADIHAEVTAERYRLTAENARLWVMAYRPQTAHVGDCDCIQCVPS